MIWIGGNPHRGALFVSFFRLLCNQYFLAVLSEIQTSLVLFLSSHKSDTCHDYLRGQTSLISIFFVLCRGTKSHISRKMPRKNCGHFNVILLVMYFYSRATITKAFLNCRVEIHQGTATFKSYFFLLLFLAYLMNLFSTQSKIFLFYL